MPSESEQENDDPMAEYMAHSAAEGSCTLCIGYDSNDEEIFCGEPCNPSSQICKSCLRGQKMLLYGH